MYAGSNGGRRTTNPELDNGTTVDDIREILKYLPHRYPFLMVDRVTAFEANTSLSAIKNVTVNEPIFTGHFPQSPIFPGVLILEAMAQASALLAFKSMQGYPSEKTLYLLVGIDKARFKKQVIPGDQIIFDVAVEREKRGIWRFNAIARVDGVLVCSADVLIARNEIDD